MDKEKSDDSWHPQLPAELREGSFNLSPWLGHVPSKYWNRRQPYRGSPIELRLVEETVDYKNRKRHQGICHTPEISPPLVIGLSTARAFKPLREKDPHNGEECRWREEKQNRTKQHMEREVITAFPTIGPLKGERYPSVAHVPEEHR